MSRLLYLLCFMTVVAATYADCPQTAEGFEILDGLTLVARSRVIVHPLNPALFRTKGRQIVESVLDTHTFIPPIREIGGINSFVVDVPAFSTSQLLTKFGQSKLFEWFEPDFIIREAAEPNDDLYSEQWNLPRIQAPTAWDKTKGSRNVVVAVVDSGMLLSHRDLSNNRWRAPKDFTMTIGSTTISCLKGDGGYDVLKGTCNPIDETGHGTHVAGIIGAEGNNTDFGVGVNWFVRLLPLRFIGPTKTGCVSDAVDMLDFVRRVPEVTGTDVRIVNMSWGLYMPTKALQTEIALLHASKILLVAAAGNNFSDNDAVPFYPAGYTNDVISVAATDQADGLVQGVSNFGKNSVHLGAPGVNIISTWNVSPYFMILPGTSMAAAHVSGAAALLLSACKPTADQLKQLLVMNVDSSAALRNVTISGGRLNVTKALNQCVTQFP
jgi:subtilisin family serine protease